MDDIDSKFVVHCHTIGADIHWDLMLQMGNSLTTWQISEPPERWLDGPIRAKKIFNHRLKYLTYQGEISNNRGNCKIVISGHYRTIKRDSQYYYIQLQSPKLQCYLKMTKKNKEQWLLEFNEELSTDFTEKQD